MRNIPRTCSKLRLYNTFSVSGNLFFSLKSYLPTDFRFRVEVYVCVSGGLFSLSVQARVVPHPARAPEGEDSLQGTGRGAGEPDEHPPLEKAGGEPRDRYNGLE